MVCLRLLNGPQMGACFVLEGDGVWTIGRGEDALIQVKVANISRLHAQLTRHGNVFRLEDLSSTNGTFINGKPVRQRLVVPGDLICCGDAIFRLE